MEASLPEGVHAAPLLELGLPHLGQVRIVAAMHRPGPPPTLSVELLDFDQNNPQDRLQPSGEPRQILRLKASDPPAGSLGELRRQMAAPGSRPYRPTGYTVPEPSAVLARLASAAAEALDATKPGPERTEALALLARGLDDAILFERDRLHRVLAALADGPWVVASESAVGQRRHAVRTAGPGDPLELELVRKSGGWVLGSMNVAAETGG